MGENRTKICDLKMRMGKIAMNEELKNKCLRAVEKVREEYPELTYYSIRCMSDKWMGGSKASCDSNAVIYVNMEKEDLISDHEALSFVILHEMCHIRKGHHKKDYSKLSPEEKFKDEDEADDCVADILVKHGKTPEEMLRMYDKAHGFY